MAYLFLTLAFLMNASANVLLRLAALHGFSFSDLRLTTANMYVALAALSFAGNLVCYLVALKSLPLSTAYPIMIAATFLIVTMASLMLGEKFSALHTAGIGIILFGIVLVSVS